jgi:hypothetical protein
MSLPFFALLAMDGLVVRTTTPLALCPTVEAVEVALSERMHVVDEDHEHWEVVFENAHRTEPAADLLRVQVLDEHGEARADQLLDVSGADCNVRAQTVALVVADYFESRHVEPAPQPEPAPAPAPAPPDTPSPAPRAERHDHLSVGVGVGLSENSSLGFAARLVGRPTRFFELSALVLAPGRDSEHIGQAGQRGKAELWTWPLRLSAALSLHWSRLGLWLGPEALLSYERGTTQGIAHSQTNHRGVFGVGGQVGLRYATRGSWAGYVVFAADYPLPLDSSRFEIEVEGEGVKTVLAPGPVRWGAALGVDYDVF